MVFFGNTSNVIQSRILDISKLKRGSFPFSYLGITFITSRLRSMDCKRLVEAIMTRIQAWTSKHLSFAGRLQRITSVLNSMKQYWCMNFVLPKQVLQDCDELLRRFLWFGTSNTKTSGKVRWSMVCRPKEKGGRGLRNSNEVNKATMLSIL
ncbi:hypothetical protein CFOL_v3_09064 [Cephalotus follicularis]|uniref:RVT_1 domain-containing protein n=1 Tax=Cephalotus follicularis TaxID=3775 RepID=A0A1Q3BCA5_CEPFO|nr:hypothetical protein CFOL_v3_09064 [Cephalotus follicularis]